jgi:hypothetical protein
MMPSHATKSEPQAASAVFVVRPTAFASNPQTLASNAFQNEGGKTNLNLRARSECDAVTTALTDAGVRVHVFEGRIERDCPDEIFPNNWISFHADGTVVLYPLLAPNRRRERRRDMLDTLTGEHRYRLSRTIDLTSHEADGRYLEGTGSLVLDRPSRVAYLCRSPRSNERVLVDFAAQLGYQTVVFDAADRAGSAIYHTNVVMSLGTQFAVVCFDAMPAADRERVAGNVMQSGRKIVDIDLDQLDSFAANLLELDGRDGPVIALSTRALDAFDSAQRRILESFGHLVPVAIPTIERYGGGSVRCMLAEVFPDC